MSKLIRVWDGSAWQTVGAASAVGSTGPAGPTGPSGAAGPTGATGTIGSGLELINSTTMDGSLTYNITIPANTYKYLRFTMDVAATTASNVAGTIKFNNNSNAVYYHGGSSTASSFIQQPAANTGGSPVSSTLLEINSPNSSAYGKIILFNNARIGGSQFYGDYFNSTAVISSINITMTASTHTGLITVYGAL
jgi:hypothetical protein